jgi:hypothetical protein
VIPRGILVYIVLHPRFFIFQVCDVQTRDHPQEDLAKFGYRKFNLKKNPFMFWLLAKTCCRNLEILIFLKIWPIGAMLFTKLLSMCKNHNFPVNLPPKITLVVCTLHSPHIQIFKDVL